MYDYHGTNSVLLGTDGGIEVGIVYIAAFNFSVSYADTPSFVFSGLSTRHRRLHVNTASPVPKCFLLIVFVPDTPGKGSCQTIGCSPTPRESHPSEALSELPSLVATDSGV